MPNIGGWEIAIVLVLAIIIFGPKKLPELGASLGKSIRGFKKGLKDGKEEVKSTVAEVREAAGVDDFKSAVSEVREATGVNELKATVKEIRESTSVKNVFSSEGDIGSEREAGAPDEPSAGTTTEK